MKIKIIFVLIFYLIVFNAFSQLLKISEIEKELANTNSSKDKIDLYKKYIKKFYFELDRSEELLTISKKYLDLVKKLSLKNHYIFAFTDYGFSLARMGKLTESNINLKIALGMLKKVENIDTQIYVLDAYIYLLGKENDRKKEFVYFNKVKELYKIKGDVYNQALYLYMGANVLKDEGRDRDRLLMFEKAYFLFKKVGAKEKMLQMIDYIGYLNTKLGYYDKALKVLIDGFKQGEKIKDFENCGKIAISIGDLFLERKNYSKAILYYRKGAKLFLNLGKDEYSILTNRKLGQIYFELKEYEKALKYFNLSLKKQLIQGKKIRKSIGSRLIYTYRAIGHIYLNIQNYKEAEMNFNTAFELGLKLNAIRVFTKIYNSFGILYNKKGLYKKSISNLKKSILYTAKIKDDILQKQNYLIMSQNYEKIKDYKNSLKYHKLHFKLERKIFNEKNTKNLADIETKYETEKKDLEINSLKEINKIKEREKILLSRERNLIKKQQRYLMYSTVFGVILLIVFLFFLIKKYRLLMAFWKKKNFVGKYRLDKKIATGGMGIIYKASDILDKDNKKTFAIKVLREEYFEDDEMKKRFKFEGSMIDQLDHKNIVKVFERGESADSHYLVMEYLNGKNLGEVIKERGQLDIITSLSIMKQTTDAVKTIHSKGILHRDLKPENIMLLEEEGQDVLLIKLLDFGLAKSDTMTKMTITGMVMGTSNYISPEQLTGDDITIASDIYSLGVIFYEMLSGEKLFLGKSEEAIFQKILTQERIPLMTKRPDIPAKLNHLIMSMLAKEKVDRPEIDDIIKTIGELKI